ncbi:MAG: hypothetical protein HGB35_02480 [Geobacteraceae bacterium]|nr:hypothetical protein [Geobacteraceae bacterium]
MTRFFLRPFPVTADIDKREQAAIYPELGQGFDRRDIDRLLPCFSEAGGQRRSNE